MTQTQPEEVQHLEELIASYRALEEWRNPFDEATLQALPRR